MQNRLGREGMGLKKLTICLRPQEVFVSDGVAAAFTCGGNNRFFFAEILDLAVEICHKCVGSIVLFELQCVWLSWVDGLYFYFVTLGPIGVFAVLNSYGVAGQGCMQFRRWTAMQHLLFAVFVVLNFVGCTVVSGRSNGRQKNTSPVHNCYRGGIGKIYPLLTGVRKLLDDFSSSNAPGGATGTPAGAITG